MNKFNPTNKPTRTDLRKMTPAQRRKAIDAEYQALTLVTDIEETTTKRIGGSDISDQFDDPKYNGNTCYEYRVPPAAIIRADDLKSAGYRPQFSLRIDPATFTRQREVRLYHYLTLDEYTRIHRRCEKLVNSWDSLKNGDGYDDDEREECVAALAGMVTARLNQRNDITLLFLLPRDLASEICERISFHLTFKVIDLVWCKEVKASKPKPSKPLRQASFSLAKVDEERCTEFQCESPLLANASAVEVTSELVSLKQDPFTRVATYRPLVSTPVCELEEEDLGITFGDFDVEEAMIQPSIDSGIEDDDSAIPVEYSPKTELIPVVQEDKCGLYQDLLSLRMKRLDRLRKNFDDLEILEQASKPVEVTFNGNKTYLPQTIDVSNFYDPLSVDDDIAVNTGNETDDDEEAFESLDPTQIRISGVWGAKPKRKHLAAVPRANGVYLITCPVYYVVGKHFNLDRHSRRPRNDFKGYEILEAEPQSDDKDISFVENKTIESSDVTLEEENAVSVATIPSMPPPTVGFGKNAQTFPDLTDRYNNLGTFDWSATSAGTIIKTYNLPLHLIYSIPNNPALLPMKQFAFMRPQLTMRFQLNATPYHQGCLVIGVMYYPKNTEDVQSSESRVPIHANQLTQLNHGLLLASGAGTVEIDIPFISPFDMIPIRQSEYGNSQYYASVYVGVLSPLKFQTGATTHLTVTTQCSLSCKGIPTEFYGLQPYSEIIEPQGYSGIISSAGRSLTAVADNVLAPIESLFTGPGSSNRVSNCDKPVIPTESQTFLPYHMVSLSHGEGPSQARTLRLNPYNLTPSNPSLVPMAADDLGVEQVTRKWGYLGSFNITDSRIVNSAVIHYDITPFSASIIKAADAEGKGRKILPTPLMGVASMYQYWTGGLEFKFILVKAGPHSVRLRFTVYPIDYYDGIDVNSSYSVVADFGEGIERTIVVPYLGPTKMLPTIFRKTDTTDVAAACGVLVVTLESRLMCMSAVTNNIDVLVFSRAADDFQLSVPRPTLLCNVEPHFICSFSFENTWNGDALPCESFMGGRDADFVLNNITKEDQVFVVEQGNYIVLGNFAKVYGLKWEMTIKRMVRQLFGAEDPWISGGIVFSCGGTMKVGDGSPFDYSMEWCPLTATNDDRVAVHARYATINGVKIGYIRLRDIYQYNLEVVGTSVGSLCMKKPEWIESNPKRVEPQGEERVEAGVVDSLKDGTSNVSVPLIGEDFPLKSCLRRYTRVFRTNLSVGGPSGQTRLVYDVNFGKFSNKWYKVDNLAFCSSGFRFARGSLNYIVRVTPVEDVDYNVIVHHIPSGYSHRFYSAPSIVLDRSDIVDVRSFSREMVGSRGSSHVAFVVPFYNYANFLINGYRPSEAGFTSRAVYSLGSIVVDVNSSKPSDFDVVIERALGDDANMYVFQGWPIIETSIRYDNLNSFTKWPKVEPQGFDEKPVEEDMRLQPVAQEDNVKNLENLDFGKPWDAMLASSDKRIRKIGRRLRGRWIRFVKRNPIVLEPQDGGVIDTVKAAASSLFGGLKETLKCLASAAIGVSAKVISTTFQHVLGALGGLISLTKLFHIYFNIKVLVYGTDLWAKIGALSMLLLEFGIFQGDALMSCLLILCEIFFLTRNVGSRAFVVMPQGLEEEDAKAAITQFCALIFGGITAVCGFKSASTYSKGISDMFRLFSSASNSWASFLGGIGKVIVDSILFYVGYENPDAIASQALSDLSFEMSEWTSEVMYLINPKRVDEVQNDPKLRMRVAAAYDKAQLLLTVIQNQGNPKVQNAFFNLFRSLSNVFETVGHVPGGITANIAPISIWLDGPSGVGKSNVAENLAIKLNLAIGGAFTGRPTFTRSCQRKYWDGYTGQPIIVFDDALQVKSQEAESIFLQDWFSLNTNAPFTAEFSAICEKKKYVAPTIIVACANSAYPVVPVTDKSAFWRRRDMLLRVEMSDYIKEKYPDIVDMNDLRVTKEDMEEFKHLKFGCYGSPRVEQAASTITEWRTYPEIVSLIIDKGVRIMDKRVGAAKRILTDADELLPEVIKQSYERMLNDFKISPEIQALSAKLNLFGGTVEKQGDEEFSDAEDLAIEDIMWRSWWSARDNEDDKKLAAVCEVGCGNCPTVYRTFCDNNVHTEQERCILGVGHSCSMGVCIDCSAVKYKCVREKEEFVLNLRVCDDVENCNICKDTYVKECDAMIRYKMPVKRSILDLINLKRETTTDESVMAAWYKKTKQTILDWLPFEAVLLVSVGLIMTCFVSFVISTWHTAKEVGVLSKSLYDSADNIVDAVMKPIGQIASSGDVRTMTGKIRRKVTIPGARPQGATDDLYKRIYKNRVLMTVTYAERHPDPSVGGCKVSTKQMFGLGLRGRYLVIPNHLFLEGVPIIKVTMQVFGGSEPGGVVDIGIDGFERKQINNTDIALVHVTNKRIPQFKSIVGSLVEGRSIGNICTDSALVEADAELSSCMKIHVLRSRRVEAQLTYDGTNYFNLLGFGYGLSRKGLCGSVLVDTLHNTIIGMHTSGTATEGFSSIICSEFFEGFNWEGFEDVELPTNLEEQGSIVASGEFVPLGAVSKKDMVSMPIKTAIIPSDCVGVLSPPVRYPVDMKSEDDKRFPGQVKFVKAIEKGFNPPSPFKRALVDEVVTCLTDVVVTKAMPRVPVVPERTVEEAIVGVEGVPFMKALYLNTSPGYPFTTMGYTKKKQLVKVEIENNYPKVKDLHPLLRQEYERCHELRIRGVQPLNIWQNFLKDERLKQGKNPRLINGAPLDMVIEFRRYFLDFVAALQSNNTEVHIGVGMDVHSPEWSSMVNKLLGMGNKFLCADYSGFGPGLDPELVLRLADIICAWMERHARGNIPSYFRRVVVALLEASAFSIEITRDTLIQTLCGSPSGSPETVIVNSLVNLLYMLLAWCEIFKGTNLANPHNFFKYVMAIVYGDDIIATVSDDVAEMFNNETISKVLGEHGIIYTDADKTRGTIRKWVSIEDASFLKCSILPHPTRGQGYWLAALEKPVIEDIANWVRKPCPDIIQQSLENCRDLCRHAYGHGIEYHSQVVAKLTNYWSRRGEVLAAEGWHEIDSICYGEQALISTHKITPDFFGFIQYKDELEKARLGKQNNDVKKDYPSGSSSFRVLSPSDSVSFNITTDYTLLEDEEEQSDWASTPDTL